MKRFLAIILAGLMLLSLAACGGKDDDKVKIGVLQTGQMEGFQSNEAHNKHRKTPPAPSASSTSSTAK